MLMNEGYHFKTLLNRKYQIVQCTRNYKDFIHQTSYLIKNTLLSYIFGNLRSDSFENAGPEP